ncbi:MAG: T9SS type A sorting domain-containing protein [Bacteroidales bacterium]|nr:T9SS type A sorting domain-containing protein [Bacteroidales bacterium]
MKKVLFSLLLAVLCLPFAMAQTKAPRTIITLDTVACDSLAWVNNQVYTSDTTVMFAKNDTVYLLNLTINHAYYNIPAVDIEAGCSYTWQGHTVMADTTLTDTLKTVSGGCDSVATVNLTFTHLYTHDTAIAAFNKYVWFDSTYTESTIDTHHIAADTINQCDSTFIINLTINQKRSKTIDIKACGSYHWRVERYGTLPRDTTYTYYGDSTTGSYYRTREVAKYTIIDTTFYKDPSLGDTNVYEYTLDGNDSIAGRDSLVRLYMDTIYTIRVTISDVKQNVKRTTCGSYQWNGFSFSATGIYDTIYHGANNCDSILHLDLKVEATTETSNVESCGSYKWSYAGNEVFYHDTTVIRQVVSTVGECDTVIKKLVLKITHPEVNFQDSACGTYTWRNNQYQIRNIVYTRPDSAKGSEVIIHDSIYRIDSTTMCDTMIRLSLKLKSMTGKKDIDTAACTVFKFRGREFRENMNDTVIITSNRKCDTVYNVKLKIFTNTDTTERQVCQSYINGNDTITTDSTIAVVETDTNGCVSQLLLNLKIVNNFTKYDTVENCGDYKWLGKTLHNSVDTTAVRASTNPNVPCDSIYGLVLTIVNNVKADTITKCGAYTNWKPFSSYTDTNKYYASTDLAVNDTNKRNSCVTEHKLHLIIADNYKVDTNKYFCGSYYWRKNRTRFYEGDTIITLSKDSTLAIRGDSASICRTYRQLKLNIVSDSVAPVTTETRCDYYPLSFVSYKKDPVTNFSVADTIVDTIRTTQFREMYNYNDSTRCNIKRTYNITILPLSVGSIDIDTITCEALHLHLGDTNFIFKGNITDSIVRIKRTGKTAASCYDSTATVNLRVYGKTHTTPHNPTYNVCDRYVWYYSDKKVVDDIVNPRDTIINGATVRIQDTLWHWEIDSTKYNIYTRSASDSIVLGKDVNSCDSVAMLNLTVYHTPVVTIVGDWDLNIHDTARLSYECDQPNATHTWSYDNSHGTNLTIPDVTQNIDITLVSIGEGGCTRTSYITVMANDNIGIDQVETTAVELYPNPTTAYLNLRCEQPVSEVAIFNNLGQRVSLRSNLGTAATLDLSQFATGSYSMRITLADGQTIVRKFIVSK